MSTLLPKGDVPRGVYLPTEVPAAGQEGPYQPAMRGVLPVRFVPGTAGPGGMPLELPMSRVWGAPGTFIASLTVIAPYVQKRIWERKLEKEVIGPWRPVHGHKSPPASWTGKM